MLLVSVASATDLLSRARSVEEAGDRKTLCGALVGEGCDGTLGDTPRENMCMYENCKIKTIIARVRDGENWYRRSGPLSSR